MIRYECNDCGKLIDDEENMKWNDIIYQQCEECYKKEQKEYGHLQADEKNKNDAVTVMNKDTIKHYKQEFQHWLDGGSLLSRWILDSNSNWTTANEKSSVFFTNQIGFPEYIINDEKVSFRKAEAENKQVQYRLYNSGEWKNCTTKDQIFSQNSAAEYRIRKSLNFKVGDWAINLRHPMTNKASNPFEVEEKWIDNRPGGNTEKTGRDCDFIKWEPVPTEWCIFRDIGMESYRIAKFKQIAFGSGKENKYKDAQGNYFDFVFPLEYIKKLKKDNSEKIKK